MSHWPALARGSAQEECECGDVPGAFTDADFRLGFNAAQTTLAAVARLVEARLVGN